MGGSMIEVNVDQSKKELVLLLMCNCKDCTHWEIGKNFILCKTCGLSLDVTVIVPDHDSLMWQEHER